MRGTCLACLALAALGAAACSSGADAESHPDAESCPSEVGEQVACFVALAEALDESLQPKLVAAVTACAGIVTELGGTPPAFDESDLSFEDTTAVCDAASEAITAAIHDGASASLTTSGGECTEDAAALQACEEAGHDPVCAATCAGQAHLDAECTSSSVSVEPPNTALASTLEDHLPALLDLLAFTEGVVMPASSSAGEAVRSLTESLQAYPACERLYGEEVSRAAELIVGWAEGMTALASSAVGVTSATAG